MVRFAGLEGPYIRLAAALVLVLSLAPAAAFAQEEEEGGFSIFGLRLSSPDKEEKRKIKDPANTIILTLGIGYDTRNDKTPEKTGVVEIELLPKVAPNHVKRIKTLIRKGYYNGKLFHRVVEGFMAQTGSPTGDGIGGAPGYSALKAEFSKIKFERGVVGMARTQDENSANAQFFIMFGRDFSLDEKYTVVGRVLNGMDAVEKLERTAIFTAQGEQPLADVSPDRIVKATIAADAR